MTPSRAGGEDHPRIGLTAGVRALLHAARFLQQTPRAWPFAAAPVAAALALCALSIVLALQHVVPELIALLPHSGVLWHAAELVLRWIAVALAAVLGLWFGSWLAPLVSAPALERLIRLREASLKVTPRPAASTLRQFSCALQAQLAATAVIGPIIVVLWLVTWLAPPAALVTVPLEFLALSSLLAWSTLDYPLSLRGMPVSARFALLRRHAVAVLGYGAALAALFAIPFLSLFVLPIAVVAAAELSSAMEPAPAAAAQH